ncbi:MAG: ABC transporter permease [Dehalococcoidia bacterium]
MAEQAVSLTIPQTRHVGNRERIWRRYKARPSAIVATAVLLSLIAVAVFANQVAPHDPNVQALSDQLKPPFWMAGGGADHLLGTDRFGRDMLSRIIHGARVSLTMGFVAATLAATLGVTLGLTAGYFGGLVDRTIMRLSDIQIAFPFLVVAIAVIAVLGSNLVVLVGLLSVAGWVFYGRITRGLTLRLRRIEYVEAARAAGAGSRRIVAQHILPNVLSPNLVLWTLSIATLILVESSLSFLGLGVQPPTPSWGNLLSDGRSYVDNAWWIAIFPGLAITVTVLAVNTLGDALRDILDPRL